MNNTNKKTEKPTLCLNMIVKNESKIITRLFDSVLPIIDCYCICDTGSTDNTIELIETYFVKKNIPGKIVKEHFHDFSYNRNFALKSCIGMSDYIILLDADMILNIRNFDKSILNSYDSFTILQGNEHFYYLNRRIVKNDGKYDYVGVTHEYINTPSGCTTYVFKKNELFVIDIGDGGAKSDKFERDIRLLLNGIKNEPDNVRYHFYLANTYKDSGNQKEAIEYYEKRIKFGGWIDEVWQSFYKMGFCYKEMGNIESAIYCWLNAYDLFPERIENLYQIVQHYREISKHKLAFQFYNMALNELNKNKNRDSYLFLENDIYLYKLFYEYTIFAYYIGIRNINDEFIKIVNTKNINKNIYNSLLTNFVFYANKIEPTTIVDLTNELDINMNNDMTKFRSSSSCLIPFNEGYLLNVRYVNYFINPNGSYYGCDKHTATINKMMQLTKDFQIKDAKLFDLNFENRCYVGVEDVRIFKDILSKDIIFTGTGFHKNSKIGVVYGDYNIDIKQYNLTPNEIICSFNRLDCEKNWVFVDYKNETHMIYSWNPLQIGKLNEGKTALDLVIKKEMPELFSNIRGSSSGFTYYNKKTNLFPNSDNDSIQLELYEKEIWFITHLVSYENPRHYYHLIVVFDEEMNLLRYSAPFKFEGEPIEYCLSILIEDDRVLINYSCWDRTTKIAVYNKKYIDTLLKYT